MGRLIDAGARAARCASLCVALVACHAAAPRGPAAPSPADGVVLAIEQGDLRVAMRALCAAYAGAGLPCADSVRLDLLRPDDVMSRIGDQQDIHMQPMPESGFAYWDNWSQVLAGGAWRPRTLFADETEARRVASMLLVTVLAHELGHHVAERHGCHPAERPLRELRADELSLPIVLELARDPRLRPLHARMRQIADAMIAAAGGAEAAPEAPLPSTPGAYAAVHLARQRRLLAGPLADVAHDACLGPWQARMAQRRFPPAPATVSTRARLKQPPAALAVDRGGTLYAIDMFPAGDHRTFPLRPLAPAGIDRPVTLPPDSSGVVTALAMFSADRFAISDGSAVYVVEGPGLAPHLVAPIDPAAMAFDAGGELLVATRGDRDWTVGPPGAPPRWSVPLDDGAARDYGDGAPGHAWPTLFAIAGADVVFFDGERHALRATSARGLVTLAGSRAGRRDGARDAAEIFELEALAATADGTLVFVDAGQTDLALRELRAAQR